MLVFIILGMIYVTSLFGYVMITDSEMYQFMTTDVFDYQMDLVSTYDTSIKNKVIDFTVGIMWLCLVVINWPVVMLFDAYVFKYLKY